MTADEEILALLREQTALLRKLVDRQKIAGKALLTVDAGAKALGVRRGDLLAWVQEGRVRTVDVDGKDRIPRSEVERLQREGLPEKATRKKASGDGLTGWKP